MGWFRKATREEKIQKRVESVFAELTSTIECEFTELETVQILNEVRVKLAQNLENKRQKCISSITENNAKLKELKHANDYLK
jgi:hypothetical protein